jgi:hypothetical protein
MSTGSIHVALVRVRELAEPWELVYQPSFGGCRSWITLTEPPAGCLENARPVIDDAEFAVLERRLLA